MGEKKIRVIEHSGFMETKDDIFDIEPGIYTFIVENKSHKTSEFIVVNEDDVPIVKRVHKGKTTKFEMELHSGNYSYYCPVIPTPSYQIKGK